MREMWRVLRDDGTCFVNLGDSYNGSGGAGGDYGPGGIKEGQPKYPGRKISALKPKDLMMIPARFALAAQADGWYLRSDIIWHKKAPMPESVTDRPTRAHEFIYLLTKIEKYYYDADAIREPLVTESNIRNKSLEKHNAAVLSPIGQGEREWNNPNGRNKRTVWTLGPAPFKGAHFATFPIELPLTCIKAGTSEHGVCPECLAPWQRVTERTAQQYNEKEGVAQRLRNQGATSGGTEKVTLGVTHLVKRDTLGWQPACTCGEVVGYPSIEVPFAPGGDTGYWAAEPIPATVLDCFNGSGTSGKAAMRVNRSYIGVDICNEYLTDLAPARMSNVQIEMALT